MIDLVVVWNGTIDRHASAADQHPAPDDPGDTREDRKGRPLYGHHARRVLLAVAAFPVGATFASMEIRTATQCSSYRIAKRLDTLIRQGAIRRIDRGRYQVLSRIHVREA